MFEATKLRNLLLRIYWIYWIYLGYIESIYAKRNNCFKVYLFILRQSEQGRGRERDRENPKQAPHHQHRAGRRTQSHNPEIMTWAEIKSRTLNRLSPEAPLQLNIFKQH